MLGAMAIDLPNGAEVAEARLDVGIIAGFRAPAGTFGGFLRWSAPVGLVAEIGAGASGDGLQLEGRAGWSFALSRTLHLAPMVGVSRGAYTRDAQGCTRYGCSNGIDPYLGWKHATWLTMGIALDARGSVGGGRLGLGVRYLTSSWDTCEISGPSSTCDSPAFDRWLGFVEISGFLNLLAAD